jgi:drug/metabolite transporter (DMT)-like permease
VVAAVAFFAVSPHGLPPSLRAAGASASPAVIAQFLVLAVIGTAGTFTFQTWAQHHMSATHAAIIFTLEPVFTAIVARWFLSETLTARGWAGGALVVAGIVVSELRLRPKRNG